ncbi:alkylation response protein AidB-like acyl-CoA dehydrogenase [Nocardia transvalensis]|uniref:Alkylation response protein AidB-like acyl-CoA dehydrogenase n=1 Tax=Nocardia transvalensis TaxID=37333 RepID=A0A7W9PC13_9NOCA|nr:acyl-CoA dehydrogenase family protein [Nocardia transvalensis]MBB5913221.1 alkylation response protein AidB-like acyl-CoA dehydrogenase [Nocardia transvalensis]
MDFTPTEGQQDLGRLTGEVCGKLVTADRLRELDTADVRFDDALWRSLGETGVLAATLPETVGGSGLTVLEQTAVLRELGKYVAAVPYLWSVVLGAGALAEFGSEAQRELAAKAGAGETILTAALAEERNWEPARPTTTAAADGAGWRLTGAKIVVPFAEQASRILVSATVSGAPAVFLVDPSDASVRVTGQQVVDRSPEAELEFDSTPAELVGTVESGGEILDWLLSRGWLGLAAQQLGTLERALELVAEYGREREQFGRKIGSFQAVAQRMADSYVDLQGLRLAVTQAAWMLAEGLPATPEIHTAKFWAADAGHRIAHTVVHVHGGVGIDRDHVVHNYFTAAKHNEFALGGSTDHLRALGAHLAEPR